MFVIYQCYGGTHSSVIAANIHLNRLPISRVPRFIEVLKTPHFDRLENSEIGILNCIGIDGQGNHVFSLGSGSRGNEVKQIMKELLPLLGLHAEEIAIVNCLDQVNILARVGGFISRFLGLVFLGRPLVILGIRMRYRALANKVRSFKEGRVDYMI